MAVDYTTTALLAAIRRHAMIPGPSTGTNTDTLDDTDLLAMATEEMWTYVVPLLVSVNEEYFVVSTTTTISPTVTTLQIPSDAVSEGLRDVQILDGDRYKSLARIEPEREGDLYPMTGTPTGYRLEGNTVVLVPAPSITATVKIKYFRRPGVLIPTASAGVILSADPGVSIDLSYSPSWAGTSTVVEFVAASPPFLDPMTPYVGRNTTNTLGTSSGGPPTDVTYGWTISGYGSVSLSDMSALLGGCYVCRFGETCVPQIPPEFQALLALRTAQVAMESLGDQRSEGLEKRCERMKLALLTTIAPRARGKGRTVINPYAPGTRSPRWRRFR